MLSFHQFPDPLSYVARDQSVPVWLSLIERQLFCTKRIFSRCDSRCNDEYERYLKRL